MSILLEIANRSTLQIKSEKTYTQHKSSLHQQKDVQFYSKKPATIEAIRVKEIEVLALALGWHHDQLWNNPRTKDQPLHKLHERGLICSIKHNVYIREVTPQYIELLIKEKTRTVINRFFNMRVDQPFLKHIKT